MKIKFWNTKHEFYMDDESLLRIKMLVDHNGKVFCYDPLSVYESVQTCVYTGVVLNGEVVHMNIDCEKDVRVGFEY